jgi:transposase
MRGQRETKYSEAFKANAVRMVEQSGEASTVVAARLGVNYWALRNWCREAMKKKHAKKARVPESNESAEARSARLEQEHEVLRKRIEHLETERAILKKAAAFFAKESE